MIFPAPVRKPALASLLAGALLLASAQGVRADADQQAFDRQAGSFLQFFDAGDYKAAEPAGLKALELAEQKFGGRGPVYASLLDNLGQIYKEQGRYAEAEAALQEALQISRDKAGPDHPLTGLSWNSLGALSMVQGRFTQARERLGRAQEILEPHATDDPGSLAAVLNNLASLLQEQGQPEQALPLLRRVIALYEGQGDDAGFSQIPALNNLAILSEALGDRKEAIALQEQAMGLREYYYAEDSPALATGMNNLAELYRAEGRMEEAEKLYLRALEILRGGIDNPATLAAVASPDLALVLGNLSALYHDQGKLQQALPLARQALLIRQRTGGASHPDTGLALNSLALLYSDLGQDQEALRRIREATDLFSLRARMASGSDGKAEQEKYRIAFLNHLSILASIPDQDPALVDEALQIMQKTRNSDAARAVSRMSARFAAGNDLLAGLVRDFQDAGDRLEKAESLLVEASLRTASPENLILRDSLRSEIKATKALLVTLDARISLEFPAFQALARPAPVKMADLQDLLGPEEALVSLVIGSQTSYALALSRDAAMFAPLTPGQADIAASVTSLRKGLDPLQIRGQSDLMAFDAFAAHGLYQDLIAPLQPVLAGKKHWYMVPDGALESLPFSVLLTRAPNGPLNSFAALGQAPWLGGQVALTVLPSSGALRSLRRFSPVEEPRFPFRGIGDPLLKGHPGPDSPLPDIASLRSLAASEDKGALRSAAASSAETEEVGEEEVTEIAWQPVTGDEEDISAPVDPENLFAGGQVSLRAVKAVPALPETASELLALALASGADRDSLLLRDQATEPLVRADKRLQDSRIIAFATHGAVSGELEGLSEPALILTPPAGSGSQDDPLPAENDGLLTASEIATDLRLKADWVLLSACNTAAASGKPGAKGLSGLARAFLYAGARTLFVSHWSVMSDATVTLTTRMLEEQRRNPSIGRAEAHRRAMASMQQNPPRASFAHPLFWAPFVVVGDGG